jgi:hypothetical protein
MSYVLKSQEIRILVPYESIMREVEVLKLLSRRLDILADEHSTLTEALLPISAGILRIATVLEVLAISRSDSRPV